MVHVLVALGGGYCITWTWCGVGPETLEMIDGLSIERVGLLRIGLHCGLVLILFYFSG